MYMYVHHRIIIPIPHTIDTGYYLIFCFVFNYGSSDTFAKDDIIELRIAGNLGVDSSTVYRIVELFLRMGNVEKKYEGCNLIIKVTEEMKCFIIHVVLDNPGIMLHEIQTEIFKAFNMEIVESTLGINCNFLGKRCVLLLHNRMKCFVHCLQVKLVSTRPTCLCSLMKLG